MVANTYITKAIGITIVVIVECTHYILHGSNSWSESDSKGSYMGQDKIAAVQIGQCMLRSLWHCYGWLFWVGEHRSCCSCITAIIVGLVCCLSFLFLINYITYYIYNNSLNI